MSAETIMKQSNHRLRRLCRKLPTKLVIAGAAMSGGLFVVLGTWLSWFSLFAGLPSYRGIDVCYVHARTRALATAAEYNIGLTTVVGGTEPVRTNVAYVSRDFFKVLGVQPVTGRGWLSEETKIGGSPTVIVSHGFWERVLGSRNDLASTALRIGEHSFAGVGVMPERFDFPKSAEVR